MSLTLCWHYWHSKLSCANEQRAANETNQLILNFFFINAAKFRIVYWRRMQRSFIPYSRSFQSFLLSLCSGFPIVPAIPAIQPCSGPVNKRRKRESAPETCNSLPILKNSPVSVIWRNWTERETGWNENRTTAWLKCRRICRSPLSQTNIKLCWNFWTIYGGKEPSRNRVVLPARQAT
jgi:hypothetical protein